MTIDWTALRSLLFLPASNSRAIAKARTLDADMVVIDLEDAVPSADKPAARAAAVAAVAEGFGRPAAIRINGIGTQWHADDLAAALGSAADLIVLPKVEAPSEPLAKPLVAMIESPAGVLAASTIAAAPGVIGLMAGVNDLAAALRLPPHAGRDSLALALQTIVLAARAAGVAVFDGVFNRLDDPTGFALECEEGRALGFDGKSLIHPSQIEPANRLFGPSASEIEDARALVAAATGGAERFAGRMVEELHVAAARRLLDRARR